MSLTLVIRNGLFKPTKSYSSLVISSVNWFNEGGACVNFMKTKEGKTPRSVLLTSKELNAMRFSGIASTKKEVIYV